MPPLTGDKKPEDFVPDDHSSEAMRKELEELDKKFPKDEEKEKKDAKVRERPESDKN
jgi:hypothetical protein